MKITLFSILLFATLIFGQGSTNALVSAVWNIAYWFVVIMMWISLGGVTLIVAFSHHPGVRSRLQVAKDKNKGKRYIALVPGGVILGIYLFVLNMPWMAAGQTLLVLFYLYLRSFFFDREHV